MIQNFRTIALAKPKHLTPKYDYPPYTIERAYVSPAALYSTTPATWRTSALAEPYPRKVYKYEKPYLKPIISPSVLTHDCSDRIEHLSRNVPWKIQDAVKRFKHLDKKRVNYLQAELSRSQSSKYVTMKWSVQKQAEEDKKNQWKAKQGYVKGKSSTDLRGDISELLEWCKLRAQPKKVPPPEIGPKRVYRKLSALLPRVINLALARQSHRRSTKIDHFKVRKGALSYEVTDYIKNLAKPRTIANPPVNDTKVSRNALRYKISDRVKNLSAPRPRANAPDMDKKENPFSVNPIALKARCSARLKELAKPKGT